MNTDYSQKNWHTYDRIMWQEYCLEEGLEKTLKLYTYRLTQDADLAIQFIDNMVKLKSREWLETRDINYLLDKVDKAVGI